MNSAKERNKIGQTVAAGVDHSPMQTRVIERKIEETAKFNIEGTATLKKHG
ncbi:MAG: hypothetical protein LBP99_00485 [Azoarcus sp.]|nr:hypothetical protein [Azoarcus sp.]